VRGAHQRVVWLEEALMKGLLLVGAGVVDRPDIVVVEANEAYRFAELLNEHGVADVEVVQVRDDDEGHRCVLSC
jgi:hypothetical protein